MKRLKIFTVALALCGVVTSCQDQIDVVNPNEPTTETMKEEKGFVKFAQGGIYINGFVDIKGDGFADGVLGPFWANGLQDIMADNIGAEAANVFMNQIGAPLSVKLDNGTTVGNPNAPARQPAMLTQNNLNANAGQNPLFYEWAYMYAMNRVCNYILANVEKVKFAGDATTKINTLKAWAYWWKGFAYSRVGSLYYAGLIIDDPDKTNGDYKSHDQILAEAEKNFAAAESILNGLTQNEAYNDVMSKIIPDFAQIGKGGVLSPAMWVRNINTYRARNILANKKVSAMTTSDWDAVLAYANNGITAGDKVFTLRSNANADVLSPLAGTIAAKATGNPSTGTYKISERLVQAFQTGDKRKANNFDQLSTPWIGNVDRGNSFNTRWQMVDGGHGMPGVITYSSTEAGESELYVGGTYEENQLMKAEANIYKGNITAALPLIDEVRTYQGAGLPALAGNVLTQAEAVKQLRSERRVALLWRNVAFIDARRYGVIDPLSAGGGMTGAIVVDRNGAVSTNATIDYTFMDYWHVPDNELVYNKPSASSAPVLNPNSN